MNKNLQQWVSVGDRLPEDNQYVLAVHTRGTWIDRDDPRRVNCVVVKFVRGRTEEERGSDGYRAGDEGYSNQKPYYWQRFGPGSFDGQEISYWLEIPDLPSDACGEPTVWPISEPRNVTKEEFFEFFDVLRKTNPLAVLGEVFMENRFLYDGRTEQPVGGIRYDYMDPSKRTYWLTAEDALDAETVE